MVIYNIVTGICFVLLAAVAAYFFVNLFKKKRAGRIAYLRSFKRGKCIIVFLLAVPLMFLGYYYSGLTFMGSLFEAVSNIFDFVVLKIDLKTVSELMDANGFYKAAVYFCLILVFVNAVLFTLSLTSQQIWHAFHDFISWTRAKKKLVIFGYNKHSVSVYRSAKNFDAVILDKLSSEDMNAMYAENIRYKNRASFDAYIAKNVKLINKGKKVYTVVVNTLSDEKNLAICRAFSEEISKLKDEEKQELFLKLRVYVFGRPVYEAVYEDVVDRSFGCIHYINKYRIIAMNFIDKYPLSAFMDERHVDYKTCLVDNGINLNVCLIGFGSTNRQIFLTSIANNQFLTKNKDGVIKLKKVNYHIFDKDPAEENKNLNHNYFRYKNEFPDAKNPPEGDYLPAPEIPAEDFYHHFDINSPELYKDIKKCMSGKNAVNYIVVSFGTDLENIDLAHKLVEKRKEWGLNEIVIFVKVDEFYKNNALSREPNCYFIGNMSAEVYDIKEITNDKFYRMAQMRNEIYDLEYRITHEKGFVPDEAAVIENRQTANKKWYFKKTQLERESSLYCCLSLKSKLNLMGLDYREKDPDENKNKDGLSEEAYLLRYAEDDMPDTKTYNVEADGKKVVNYTLDFPASKRKTLAELEHLRWNAFMLSKGVVPASKQTILNETVLKGEKAEYTNGKNYELRRHGNITTFDGLVEFRQMIAKRNKTEEIDEDVIKYDYQILDDAYWLLDKNGFKIVEKQAGTAKKEGAK